MRQLLLIHILTIACISFGQDFEFIETKTETFYKLLLQDSIDINNEYPDGRFKVFLTDTNKMPLHIFNLKNGSVNGSYLKLTSGSWTYGNYNKDSLWTFLTAPKDTTFKIGTWKRYIYSIDTYIEDRYKMPFDSDSLFCERWYFYNGILAREAVFKKGFGLQNETYWDFETNKISKQTINSGNANYYQSITYEYDSISKVSLIQNGIEININFDYPICNKKPCMNIQVYSDNSIRKDTPLTTLTIDSSHTLSNFGDVKRQVFLSEDKEGNSQLSYPTKKGKIEYIKLK